jgi:hypothetical protein
MGWTVRGSNPRGGDIFSPVQTGPEAYPASSSTGTSSFQGAKRPGYRVDHQPLSRAEFRKRVDLYSLGPHGVSDGEVCVFQNIFSSTILMSTRQELHHCRPIRSLKVTSETHKQILHF